MLVEVTGEKLVGELLVLPIMNRVKPFDMNKKVWILVKIVILIKIKLIIWTPSFIFRLFLPFTNQSYSKFSR